MQSLVSHAVNQYTTITITPSIFLPIPSTKLQVFPHASNKHFKCAIKWLTLILLTPFLHHIPSNNTVGEQESKGTVHTLWLTHQPGSCPAAPHARELLESPSEKPSSWPFIHFPNCELQKKIPHPENYKSIIFQHWIFSLLWEKWVFLANYSYSSRKCQTWSSRQVKRILKNIPRWKVFIAVNY